MDVHRAGERVRPEPGCSRKSARGPQRGGLARIRGEYERNRRAAVRVGDAYQARNPQQQWLADFDGRGFSVQPDGADWRWGLELERYGFAGQEQGVQGRARVTADKERVTYAWDGTVEEWFVNGEQGLEHGFTLRRRPDGQNKESAPLAMHLGVRGGLHPLGQPDRQGVSFVDAQGQAVVQYAGLKAWDADGKTVAARLEAAGAGLRLEVDERGARYPITIDPIAQQAYLKASNTDAGDGFGESVAVSGDTVVVGASGEASNAKGVNGDQNDNSALYAGAAYVFVRNGTTWSQQAYLKASNTDARGPVWLCQWRCRATRWWLGRTARPATPRASTATRATTALRLPGRPTSLCGMVPRGASRPT